ncbi:MAG: RHS repeat-associated core domain-containing protein [Lachnospiraceae bacterium]|nr:RHS repeat-associated core domain-containing protein [Lachnospiraceae bacterium]
MQTATNTVTGSFVSGNPISYYNGARWTFDLKNGRELATANNGTHSISYDYDVNGLRTYKIVDGVRHDYVYASGQLLRETYTQSGTDYVLDFLYDQSGRPYMLYLTTTTAGTTTSRPLYYILNLQGDVIYLVNTAGVAEASYAYDPYGSILSSGGSLANVNPLRYRGYYYDAESGFYYLQSRNYDPSLGRFINADTYSSTGQGFLGYNMFAYCCNRVISTSDQTGEFFFTAIAIGFGIGLAAQYIGDVVENVQSGETGLDILVPHSSIKDYAGSGIGCAIAAIPGFGFWGTVGLGALGNVTSDLIKGNLKDGGDVIESAVKGGLANAVGYAFQKGIEFLKVKQISNMPRTERKLFLKTNVYQNSQAFVNSNLRTFANATVSENMSIVSKTLTIFKSGIYSTLVSGILGKIIESK